MPVRLYLVAEVMTQKSHRTTVLKNRAEEIAISVRKTICVKSQRQIMLWPLIFDYDEQGVGASALPSGQGSVPVQLVQATKERTGGLGACIPTSFNSQPSRHVEIGKGTK